MNVVHIRARSRSDTYITENYGVEVCLHCELRYIIPSVGNIRKIVYNYI